MYRTLRWGSFDPKTDGRVHPSIKVIDYEESTQNGWASTNDQADNTCESPTPISNEADIDINDIQIVVNKAFVTRHEKKVLMCTQNLTTFSDFKF